MEKKNEKLVQREITKKHPARTQDLTGEIDKTSVTAWLRAKAEAKDAPFRWLLAHAEDGVSWGRVDTVDETTRELVTSHDAAQGHADALKVCPDLSDGTLWQARLFGETTELLLWRDGDNQWHARVIRDTAGGDNAVWKESFDEPQILWGTQADEALAHDFTLTSDGAQGLRHAVPCKVEGTFTETTRPLRLWVRHYLEEDKSGFVRVAASRLFDVTVEKEETK